MAAFPGSQLPLWVGSTYSPDVEADVRGHQALNGRSAPDCCLTPAEGPMAVLADQCELALRQVPELTGPLNIPGRSLAFDRF